MKNVTLNHHTKLSEFHLIEIGDRLTFGYNEQRVRTGGVFSIDKHEGFDGCWYFKIVCLDDKGLLFERTITVD